MTWLDDICNVLDNTKSEQVRFDTAVFNYDKNGKPDKVRAYCAMGILLCNKQPIKDWDGYDLSKDYNNTLLMYDTPQEFRQGLFPNLKDINIENMSVQGLIINLNDDWELSFSQIADFLRTTFEDAV